MAQMIELDFGKHGGGKRAFADFGEVKAYCESRQVQWDKDEVFRNFTRQRNLPGSLALREIPAAWAALAQAAAQSAELRQKLEPSRLFARQSDPGEVIASYLEKNDREGLAGALAYCTTPSNTALPGATKGHQEGFLVAWARDNGLDRKASARSRDTLRQLSADLRQREADLLEGFGQKVRACEERLEALSAAGHMQAEQHAAMLVEAEKAIAAQRYDWTTSWQEMFNVHAEQLKLKAAVKLWEDRATDHAASFRSIRRWTIGIGITGLILAVLWAWAALGLAQHVFSSALVTGEARSAPGSLRPTWLHELLFAASASLLYLTLFLWTLRILVRSMLSEQHLGADARARSNMAHTYLSLMHDAAVGDNERAIVLASLFRPISDGLVKDDALPIVSPAAILSGKLAPAPG